MKNLVVLDGFQVGRDVEPRQSDDFGANIEADEHGGANAVRVEKRQQTDVRLLVTLCVCNVIDCKLKINDSASTDYLWQIDFCTCRDANSATRYYQYWRESESPSWAFLRDVKFDIVIRV